MKLRREHRRRIGVSFLLVVLLTSIALGLTAMTAGAAPPHQMTSQETVSHAQEAAARSAAAETSLRVLRTRLRSDLSAEAQARARVIVHGASDFETLKFPAVPTDWVAEGLDLSKATREGDKLVQVLPNGGKVTFTIDPEIQTFLARLMRESNVPHGGVVLIDPPTGRVIAKSSHTQGTPRIEGFARHNKPPSASVFKIVTAAALLESAGVDPEAEVCYHGGRRGLTERNIKGDARLDKACNNLGGALVWSLNSLIAKLSYNNLSREDLQVWAERFGYNAEIPFELPVEVSTAEISEDPFERARAAAGFWHTHLSPLHGAMIGAALANDGVMMQPSLIESYESPDGVVLLSFEPKVFRRVMTAETAQKLSEMMVPTATSGTARKYFGQRRAFPRSIEVSGKTGTLSYQEPFLRFTWFVGFARNTAWGDKGVAVGGVMGNTPTWHMLGPFAASEAVRKYYEVAKVKRDAVQEVAAKD